MQLQRALRQRRNLSPSIHFCTVGPCTKHTHVKRPCRTKLCADRGQLGSLIASHRARSCRRWDEESSLFMNPQMALARGKNQAASYSDCAGGPQSKPAQSASHSSIFTSALQPKVPGQHNTPTQPAASRQACTGTASSRGGITWSSPRASNRAKSLDVPWD